jgi:hypothetical protein
MPIPTRGFARILAYVLLASVASRAAALREHVDHGHHHRHTATAVVPVAGSAALTTGGVS